MKQTRVLELTTRDEVRDFCKALLRAKELAPVSVVFTVAITTDRAVPKREIVGLNGVADPIDSLLSAIGETETSGIQERPLRKSGKTKRSARVAVSK